MSFHQVMNYPYSIPYEGPSSFLFHRKYDVHTGIDLHCPEGTEIFSILHGKVIAVENFTGESVGSPWWNETKAVVVDYTVAHKANIDHVSKDNHYIVYGEIDPCVNPGQIVAAGEKLGTVMTVLKKFKGTSTSMLHIERYCQPSSVPFEFADLPHTSKELEEYSRQKRNLKNPTSLLVWAYSPHDLRRGDMFVSNSNGEPHIIIDSMSTSSTFGKWIQTFSLRQKRTSYITSRNLSGLLYRDGKIVFPT